MMRRTVAWMGALCLLAISTGGRADDARPAAAFKAGFAERDITPEIGMEAPGGYGKAYHKSIHDPCKVRAAVFDDGRSRIAIVGILPGEFDEAPPLVQELAYKQSTCVDPAYLARVEGALIDAVCAAHDRRAEARAGVGKGIEATVAFNRRFVMRDGRTVTHPGPGNPEIVEPAGPVDPEVGVLGAWDAQEPGKLLGCVVNFACHATTSPGGISANYIHYLEKAIQGYYGKDAVVVFLAGASGDVTQVDNRGASQPPGGDRWAQLVGGKVGAEALKVLLSMEPGTLTPVEARTKVWDIPRRVPTPERVQKCLAIVQQDRSKVDATEWTFAKETVLLDALLQTQPAVAVEVQAVQVGPAVFVTTPAEYFCRYGLEIKAASGFPFTFPVSLANGCVGYVPTEDAFGPHGGGYETRLTSYSNLEITAGTQMRDAGIELARHLKPGVVPEPPRRPPFTGKPWAYGNVPPERE
jgi:neutral ceramidase